MEELAPGKKSLPLQGRDLERGLKRAEVEPVKSRTLILLSVVLLSAGTSFSAVDMESVPYAGWENCIHLGNGKVDLVATTEVGPRIVRFGFVAEQNPFKEYPDQQGKTGGDRWRIYGGHRLWHAPEALPRTYSPDNQPVEYSWDGKTLRLVQSVETTTGLQKEMEVTLDPEESHATVLHRLRNKNLWTIEAAPWCLTVMAPGGRAVIPQEPLRPQMEQLTPVRPLVLWGYTDMSDPRWTWGRKYIQLRQDTQAQTAQKVGVLNMQGWAAYSRGENLFLKRYAYDPNAVYPDFMCNTETFTNDNMLELETLGPLTEIPPEGTVEWTENWFLFKTELPEDEEGMEKALAPIIEETRDR